MPACLVGCCPNNVCDCSKDCECLLPDANFPGRFGFENPSLFPLDGDDDLKKAKEKGVSGKICPCKTKPETSDFAGHFEGRGYAWNGDNEELSCGKGKCCGDGDAIEDGNQPTTNGVDANPGHPRENGDESTRDDHETNDDDKDKGGCCGNKGCSETSESHAVPKTCCDKEGAPKKSCCSSKRGPDRCEIGGDSADPKLPGTGSSEQQGLGAKTCCDRKERNSKKSCCSPKEGSDPCADSDPQGHTHNDTKAKTCCDGKEGISKKSCCSPKEGSDPCADSDPQGHTHNDAKAKTCCDGKEGISKKSCCSSKKDSDPCADSDPQGHTHKDAKAKTCCDGKEGISKKSCCSSKKDSDPCADSDPQGHTHKDAKAKTCCDGKERTSKKSCSSSKKDSDPCADSDPQGHAHKDAKAKTCCDGKERTSKKSCSSSKKCSGPCGDSNSHAKTPTHNHLETKAGDEKDEASKKVRSSSKAGTKPSVKVAWSDMLTKRRQSYPFDDKRSRGGSKPYGKDMSANSALYKRKQSYPFYEKPSDCNVDPHHGHQHHHKHEFHHEGGHHHHDDHHHDDHHHDDHRHHGEHHGYGDDQHSDDEQHHHDDAHHHCDGHEHGDDHHHGDDKCGAKGCCDKGEEGCCDNACARNSCCDDSDCEARNSSTHTHEDLEPLVKPQVNVVIDEARFQTTKLRVQNMCCPKESTIVQEELAKLKGIKTIKVNVLGRVVHVRHHPEVVSATELMAVLNKRHLGVSIVDTGAEETAGNGLPRSLKILLGCLAVQAVLFGIALGGLFANGSWYMWVAIVEICFGVVPVMKKAFYSLRNREIDLNILITITVIGTLVIQEWIEGAAVVFVFTLANFLQQFCFYRVHKTISSLMLSKPSKAVMACTGDCIPIENVPVGAIIAVRQGELIPLDGIVVKGSASVDESSISGEAAPVEKTLRSQAYSGTVIQHGYLELETTSSSTSSTISKISAMVEDAQMNVSPTEIMVNKFARYYTPVVVVVSALVFLFPLVLGLSGVDAYEGRIRTWGERALIVLVTACPCSLLMATPIVVICGISGAARLGTLIKGGTFLEALAQVTFLAFDKTGTLTEGKFQVVDVLPTDRSEESKILRWAAALESKSSHPLAAAVVSEFTGECIADFVADSEERLLPDVSGFRTKEGQGISGTIEGHYIEIGNHSLLNKLGITLTPKFEAAYITYCSESKTVVFICVDGELEMMISMADIIRWESSAALKWLQSLGVHLAMLTGDSRQTANAVQKELKIDSCVSEMKPDDKLKWICEIKEDQTLRRRSCFRGKSAHIVGMVGDGVNDGPALAAANVGIAMAAGGSALAVEAAGVALMTNSVLKVPEMICLSRFCRRIILQNIILAVALKLVFVIVALTGFVRVWMAILADLVGLIVVIVNGLRPLKWKPPRTKAEKSTSPRASWRRKRPIFQYESVV